MPQNGATRALLPAPPPPIPVAGAASSPPTSDAFRFTARSTCYSTSDADAEQRRRCSVIEGVAAMLLGAFLPMRKPAGQLLRELGEDFLPIDDSLLE